MSFHVGKNRIKHIWYTANHLQISISISISLSIYLSIYIYIHMHIYLHHNIYMYMYKCMYIYIYDVYIVNVCIVNVYVCLCIMYLHDSPYIFVYGQHLQAPQRWSAEVAPRHPKRSCSGPPWQLLIVAAPGTTTCGLFGHGHGVATVFKRIKSQ